jgi:hypothetical protein
VLLHLEAGKTKDPDPAVLKAVALLYEVPYEHLVEKFVSYRYGVSVSNETVQNSTPVADSALPVPEGTHDPLVASTLDLASFIDGLTNTERATIRAVTVKFAMLLKNRPANRSHHALPTRRIATGRRTS